MKLYLNSKSAFCVATKPKSVSYVRLNFNKNKIVQIGFDRNWKKNKIVQIANPVKPRFRTVTLNGGSSNKFSG
jgi:hypothetical protein